MLFSKVITFFNYCRNTPTLLLTLPYNLHVTLQFAYYYTIQTRYVIYYMSYDIDIMTLCLVNIMYGKC